MNSDIYRPLLRADQIGCGCGVDLVYFMANFVCADLRARFCGLVGGNLEPWHRGRFAVFVGEAAYWEKGTAFYACNRHIVTLPSIALRERVPEEETA
jgi:hypothetical protein